MKRKTRVTALLLAALVALAVVFSCAVIVCESGHECSGADCEICLAVASCAGFLRFAGLAAVALAFVLAAFFRCAPVVRSRRASFRRQSPVILRVKLLN